MRQLLGLGTLTGRTAWLDESSNYYSYDATSPAVTIYGASTPMDVSHTPVMFRDAVRRQTSPKRYHSECPISMPPRPWRTGTLKPRRNPLRHCAHCNKTHRVYTLCAV